jgi:hypothetical protein
MKTRRMAYWWFRFVVSGRFLEEFLNLRRVGRTESVIRKSRNRFSLETNAKRLPADHAQTKSAGV